MLPLHSALAFLGLATVSFAQTPVPWSDEFDGPGQGQDVARVIVVGQSGETFVSGTIATAPPAATPSEVILRKYQPNGALAWSRTYDFGISESSPRIVLDETVGALYLLISAGTSGSSVRPWTLVRFDASSGALVWRRTYVGSSGTGGTSIDLALDASGGLVACGTLFATIAVDDVVAVVRWAADGTRTWEWTRNPPGFGSASVRTPSPDPAGGVVFVESDDATEISTLHKLDANGVELWSSTTTELVGSVNVDAASNVYLLHRLLSGGNALDKLDPQGQLLWTLPDGAIFGSGQTANQMRLASNGEPIVVSNVERVARISSAGSILWNSGLSSYDTPVLSGILRTFDIAPNDEVAVLAKRVTDMSPTGLPTLTIARYGADGAYLFGTSLRGRGGRATDGFAIAARADGAVVVGGFTADGLPATQDYFVATVRAQFRPFCFGDGSSGPCPCGNQVPAGQPKGCGNLPLSGARLEAQGIASLADDTLRLYTLGVNSGGFTMFIQGSASASAIPFQSGLLCLTGRLARLYSGNALSNTFDAPRAGSLPVSARSVALGDPILPGTRRTYQVFYRGGVPSPCSGTNGNLSNAVEVEWAP